MIMEMPDRCLVLCVCVCARANKVNKVGQTDDTLISTLPHTSTVRQHPIREGWSVVSLTGYLKFDCITTRQRKYVEGI